MNEEWQLVKKGDFGWYRDSAACIKAFWVPTLEYVDPSSKTHGKLSVESIDSLRDKLIQNHTRVSMSEAGSEAMVNGLLQAFRIHDDKRYMIVYPNGLLEQHILGHDNSFNRVARDLTFPEQCLFVILRLLVIAVGWGTFYFGIIPEEAFVLYLIPIGCVCYGAFSLLYFIIELITGKSMSEY